MSVDHVGGNPELPPVGGGRTALGLTILGAVGVPLVAAAAWWSHKPACHCRYARKAEPAAFRAATPDWETRCRAHLQSMADEMMAYSHYGMKLPDMPKIEIKNGGPQGEGLWFHISGPKGETYAAGVSGVQQGDIPDADWYSLNNPAMSFERISFFRDYKGRSGFYAAIDPNIDSLDWFGMHARAALDACLERDTQ